MSSLFCQKINDVFGDVPTGPQDDYFFHRVFCCLRLRRSQADYELESFYSA
jgi:hypothetical protein